MDSIKQYSQQIADAISGKTSEATESSKEPCKSTTSCNDKDKDTVEKTDDATATEACPNKEACKSCDSKSGCEPKSACC